MVLYAGGRVGFIQEGGWADFIARRTACNRMVRWVIVIASKSPERMEGESFSAFCSRLCSEEATFQLTGCQAYHVTQFDVAGMNFTPASRIVRL